MLKHGEIFHAFTIDRFCGEGAFGAVYLANELTGRMVALKIVSKSKAGEAWKRELRGLVNYNRLSGDFKHLIKIWHIAEDEDYFYYTMEPADNAAPDSEKYTPDTLESRLKQGRIPPAELFTLAQQLLTGLGSIHAAGMSHRDIKPSNILFVNGIPKLGDIGLLSSEQTILTHLVGTMDFIPPEIKKNPSSSDSKSGTILRKSDIYAFGMVIYCALTGNPPEKFPSLPEDLPRTSPVKQLNNLLCCACSRDPFRRIRTTDEFMVRLKNAEMRTGKNSAWKEHLCLGCEQLRFILKANICRFTASCKRHPLAFSLFMLLIISGAVWFYFYIPAQKPALPPSSVPDLPSLKVDPIPKTSLPRETAAINAKAIMRPRTPIQSATPNEKELKQDLSKNMIRVVLGIKATPPLSVSKGQNLYLTFPITWQEQSNSAQTVKNAGDNFCIQIVPFGRNAIFHVDRNASLEIAFSEKPAFDWNSDTEWEKYLKKSLAGKNIDTKDMQIIRKTSQGGLKTIFSIFQGKEHAIRHAFAFQDSGDEMIVYRLHSIPRLWEEEKQTMEKIVISAKKSKSP